MRNLYILLLASMLLASATRIATAQAPSTMSFQGYLEFNGGPADTTVALTFKLYDGSTGTATLLWTEAQPNVKVENGIFNVVLGSVTPLNSLEFSKRLWLEIEDTAIGAVFSPRTELTAAPYALGLVLPQIHDVSIGGTPLLINNVGSGDGIKGETQWGTGRGLYGQASAFAGENYGVYGFTASAEGTGVYGIANTVVETNPNYGVYGKSNSNTGIGVYGTAPKTGVYGMATASAVDAYGVRADASGLSHAVYGLTSGSGRGVFGHSTGTGRAGHFEINNTGNSTDALFAWTNGTGRGGFFQINNAGSSANALETTTNGSGYGLEALGGVFGVRASATSSFGVGVSGETATTTGIGVRGLATSETGFTYGVLGQSNSTSGHGVNALGGRYGVHAQATTVGTVANPTAGIYAKAASGSGSTSNYAAIFEDLVRMDDDLQVVGFTHFVGNVLAGEFLTVNEDLNVLGDSNVGGTKNFRIDHPLDPANRYLYHFSMESSEVLNVYSGNVTTDADGYASIMLPDWFEALNKDFRYQLTVIDVFAQAIIAEKINGNRFVIRTDQPGVDVSWQVTGVRNDRHMQVHSPVVEADKPAEMRGRYLSPEAYE